MILLDVLQSMDERLFWLLHPNHTPWLDQVMWYVSKMTMWIPVYALMMYTLFKRLHSVEFVTACIAIALLLFFTDFLAVKLVKETVQRLRPSHHPAWQHLLHLVADENGNPYRGGQYGFFSNHASNYAGVATFFYLVIRPISKLLTSLLVFWVVLISYSRIYLGVHYPFDILAGWMYGVLCAWLMFAVFKRLTAKQRLT
ncbi:MAG: phosphatase PAP2 family protein [Flavobacteriales bacterium]|jgi:undecaprenyl-diphosphatase